MSVCIYYELWGFPGSARGKEHTCQFRRHKERWLDPWVRKFPWIRFLFTVRCFKLKRKK